MALQRRGPGPGRRRRHDSPGLRRRPRDRHHPDRFRFRPPGADPDAASGLPRLADLLAIATQRLDIASGRLGAALQACVAAHRHDLIALAGPLKPGILQRPIEIRAERLSALGERLLPTMARRLEGAADRLANLEKLRLSLDPNRPLERGFARVHTADGRLARSAASLRAGEALKLVFHDGDRGARVEGASPAAPKPRLDPVPVDQGRLF